MINGSVTRFIDIISIIKELYFCVIDLEHHTKTSLM